MEAVAGASISLHANEAHANEAHANETRSDLEAAEQWRMSIHLEE